MKRILKNIKPFAFLVAGAILMLFVQAWADLRLPNYMSDIVNVGIQQSGIEHASPTEMTVDGYNLIKAILPENEAQEINDAYTIDGDRVIIKSDVNREDLDILIGKTVWTLMSFEMPGGGQGASIDNIGADFDIKEMYKAIPMLQMLDNASKQKAFELASSMEPSLISQTGVVFAKLLYADAGIDVATLQRDYIFMIGLQMMGVTLLAVGAAILVNLMATRTGSGISRNLRKEVFDKIESFSSEQFQKFSQSSLVVRTVNDVAQVQMMIMMSIRIFFYAPIMAVGGMIMIQNKATSLSWIIAVACAALLVVLVFVSLIAMPKFKIRQKLVDRLNLVFKENLSGVMVIRAFGNKEFEKDRFKKANSDVANLTLFVNRVMSLMMPIMMLIMNLTVIMVLWFGANKVSEGLIQIGDLMAFIQYAMQIIMSFLMIAMMFIFIPRALVSLYRINEVLDTENTIVDKEVTQDFIEDKRGWVEFNNVGFKYGDADEYVLKDINFTAKPGQTTAFIGSTGSGKSTLINLVPRFYDATEGSVMVNGVDVKDANQHDLREDIGYVPQKGVLLSGTVDENLKYGRPEASDEEVLHALDVAQGNFILEKDKGLDYAIAQGGTNVSGGQRQRLSIARALVKNASILIFDDSFSALDYKTDQLLRKSLKENYADTTLLIVAQRVNTILEADQIVVLDQGKMVGIGTHNELLKSCPTYYEIAASQLSEEELAYGA